jgi:cystatin-A/B
MLAGGFHQAHNADENVQNIINQVRGEVESQIGNAGEYQAVLYTSQVVAGTNYKVKVRISGEEYIHIKVYVPLPYTGNPPSLSELEQGKSLNDGL